MAFISRDKAVDITLFLVRLSAAVIFICVAGLKLFGWFGGLPPGISLSGLVLVSAIIEIICAPLLAVGLFTRPVAFIASGEMAFAYFLGHYPMGKLPIQNHGEAAFLLCFIFLFLSAYGAGYISLDAWRRNRNIIVEETVNVTIVE
jgi:putative oxidoreductase